MATDETFTHDELVNVLLEAQDVSADDDGVRTGTELMNTMEVSNGIMLQRVKHGLSSGVIEVAKTRRHNILGILVTVRGYRLKR